jgi:hypothetical protein
MSIYVRLDVMGTKIYCIERYKVKKYHNNEFKITIIHWVLWAYQPTYRPTYRPTYLQNYRPTINGLYVTLGAMGRLLLCSCVQKYLPMSCT